MLGSLKQNQGVALFSVLMVSGVLTIPAIGVLTFLKDFIKPSPEKQIIAQLLKITPDLKKPDEISVFELQEENGKPFTLDIRLTSEQRGEITKKVVLLSNTSEGDIMIDFRVKPLPYFDHGYYEIVDFNSLNLYLAKPKEDSKDEKRGSE